MKRACKWMYTEIPSFIKEEPLRLNGKVLSDNKDYTGITSSLG